MGEPCFGKLPVALDSSVGDAKDIGDLSLGQAEEDPQTHDLSGSRVLNGEGLQRLVHRQHGTRITDLKGQSFMEWHTRSSAAAFLGLLRAGMVHDD